MNRRALGYCTASIAFACLLVLAFLIREFQLFLVPSVQASEAAPPAPAAVEESKQEDELRARVRRRMEEGPQREVASIEAGAPVNDEQVKALYVKLEARQKELEEKAKMMAQREQSLAEREALVRTQLQRYEETLSSLRGEVDELRGIKNKKLEEFRKVYAKMEPKKAARILDDMDTDMAGQIISSLKESQSAEILAMMDPEKARRITARFLTGRSFGLSPGQSPGQTQSPH